MNWVLDTVPFPLMRNCEGPIVRFVSAPVYCVGCQEYHAGAIYRCAACSEIFVSGGYLTPAHVKTSMIESPL